ncbi:MAG TPA: D-glycero-beta-D-manno-heptose-7-phosphate kinase [bacterium]|nr:D-glycero-beta-D-manno-heptose-7-phosphate kinase [bacterium]HPR87236.1 D-glycero-beta-D-manno-heptose-7-phosphate kinase [bacterium]
MTPKIAREKRIREHIAAMRRQRIMVIGDLMLDEFIWGKVSRISPEAPVPVVHVSRESSYPGGAANVARNLAEFGIPAAMCGVTGRDFNGHKLIKLLNAAHIASEGILVSSLSPTIVKTRIIARNQQVVRVDREQRFALGEQELRKLAKILEKSIPGMNAVIIEDYGKGLVTQRLVDMVLRLTQEHKVLVTVDPNPGNPLSWRGATLIKPNRQEAFAALGWAYEEQAAALEEAGRALLDKWQVAYLLITMGEDGMLLFHPPNRPYHSPTRAREVYDVSGAGDTAIAFLTAALAAGVSAEEATEIANHAAGIVVGKLGTATVTEAELIRSYTENG